MGPELQEMLESDILDIADIPEGVSIPGRKSIDVDAHRKQTVYVDRTSVKYFLDTLAYPAYFTSITKPYSRQSPCLTTHPLINKSPFSFRFTFRNAGVGVRNLSLS